MTFPYSPFQYGYPYPQTSGVIYVPMPQQQGQIDPSCLDRQTLKQMRKTKKFIDDILEGAKKKDGDKKKEDDKKKKWHEGWQGVVALTLASPFIALAYGYSLYAVVTKIFGL